MNKPKKILVVDDDKISRKLISGIIENSGHVAIQSADGSRAWATLQDNPDIALIITDLMMPGMSGRDLMRCLRGNERTIKLPAIMVSGVVGMNEIQEILDLGASRFLPKPINGSMLGEYIEILLRDGD